uniref:COMM domain-containing protein 6 n=1 Tax=Capra hircus TaxID=9925 RepID=A0A452E896_CAPHI
MDRGAWQGTVHELTGVGHNLVTKPLPHSTLEAHHMPLLDQISSTFLPGDFQWKLGMAVSSDSCRSLKYPYVAVMLKVADHSGQVKNKSFEMTIPQFQVCDIMHSVLAVIL